jgi:hypothetical protein
MNEKKLRAALTDCTPQDWCRLLNGKVFFWPCIDRLNTHMAARGNRGKIRDAKPSEIRDFDRLIGDSKQAAALRGS